MNMREKLARALAADAFQRQASDAERRLGPSAFLDGWWKHYLGTTDAILDALREPTPEMIAAARGAISGYMRAEAVVAVWQIMITQAKSGEAQT